MEASSSGTQQWSQKGPVGHESVNKTSSFFKSAAKSTLNLRNKVAQVLLNLDKRAMGTHPGRRHQNLLFAGDRDRKAQQEGCGGKPPGASSVLPGFLKCMQPWPAARPDPSLSQAKSSPFNAFKLQSQPQPQGAQTFHLHEGSRSDPVLVQRSIDSIPAAFRSCLMCSSEKTVFLFCWRETV